MTDNGSPADANAASDPVEEFPSKLRVHALARVLGLTSREVLAHLAELGWHTRSPQSSVEPEMAQAVAQRVRATDGSADGTDAATPPAEATQAEATQAEATQVETRQAEPVASVAGPDVTDTDVTNPEASGASGGETPAAEAPGESPAGEAATSQSPADDTAASDTAASATAARPQSDVPMLFSAADIGSHAPVQSTGEIAAGPLFLQPDTSTPTPSRSTRTPSADSTKAEPTTESLTRAETAADTDDQADDGAEDDSSDEGGRNRRRRRGRRGRGRGRGDQADRTDSPEDSGSQGDDSDSINLSSSEGDSADSPAGSGVTSSSSVDKQQSVSGKKSAKKSGKKDVTKADGSNAHGSNPDGSNPDGSKADGFAGGGPAPDRGGADNATGRSDDKHPADDVTAADTDTDDESDDGDDSTMPSSKRRRRRRRRKGGGEIEDVASDDPPNTVVHEREPRSKRVRDEVQGISGSTRLEAKRQRRRDGRDAGRRRPPILSEAEFLARREAVERVMVVRERSANSSLHTTDYADPAAIEDYTQVAVLEDGVLVEHFVTTETSSSMVGNIYLGRVQNVLPGMEAAFVDIGRGRNGVLYAGEVNWDAAGLDGGSRKIEQALAPGDNVVVQVSKDPVGHKGARLTTQISLAGRYLVYVPGGSSTGISRKLPDIERKRLKQILAKLVPDDAGVIIRTASEGVSADELAADIERLESKWKAIESAVSDAKSEGKKGSGSQNPRALYEEPDLLVRVVRDLFNEDFRKLVIEGDKAWNLVEGYVSSVAHDLIERVEKFERSHADAPDSFVVYRIDEQLAKALDRKVWLPSGGTLIIEHTEAMTVIDVNTGKFTGAGGNLEETVTRNNLEAAEEIVRQMRLRDIGGMIIVDFIDMVLESNRDLVLRRLTEALARDRTRHQVSEVTSLGLVQMTRKRLGTGLLEAFSTTCTACGGRGVIVHSAPVEVRTDDAGRADTGSKKSRRGKRKAEQPAEQHKPAHNPAEHPMFRAMAAHAHDGDEDHDGLVHEDHDGHESATTSRQRPRNAPERNDTPELEQPEVAAPEGTDTAAESAADTVDAADAVPSTDAAGRGSTNGEVTVSAEPDTGAKAGPARRGRRRAARRAASPTTTSEVPPLVVGDASVQPPAKPLTTFGPTTETAETAVAVRQRPRRRAAGRPAGPPAEE
ncbi:Rne/Rng family ribonuclease [Gordonia oryzae]|uniref:Ribonuclease E n=1 Tax=Gordonia oryzae TaxID=2487349 RepID=A0A3N4G626_9ACTN|nr:translation initiation factor IF-2 N-terminal domain-containing protein [Gordonia oryzae]RPA58272.1 Rne/Rng family ribonuclease [Gordonia oryzae]